jgi:hypothetical protein
MLMTTRLPLWRQLFGEQPRTLLANDDFTVTAFRYTSGVGAAGGKCARLSGDFALAGANDLGCRV